ncbi:MAG: hypothetical protein FWC10_08645, partial [Lentimicrobiaceae bacterium]|nr:hypothetical protein [Lentimicrobiaceae bacterium]
MKKHFLFILAILLLSVPFTWAQNVKKTDYRYTFRKDTVGSFRAMNAIQSNYIKLSNGGNEMTQLGDPNGNGNFGGFYYNFENSNRYVIFTGLANPDPNHSGSYLQPVMTMVHPTYDPDPFAFTVSNVSNYNVKYLGGQGGAAFPLPAEAITYHDKINGSTGLPNPDGTMDGFTGSTIAVDGFLIEHTAQIGLNTYTEHPDLIEFFFTVTNTSNQARVFGLSWNVDTQIGTGDPGSGGDLAPFYVPGCREFATDQLSLGLPILPGSEAENFYNNLHPVFFQTGLNPYPNSVPEYLYALHPFEDWSALIVTNLGLRYGIQWQKVDYVAIGYYDNIMPFSPASYYFFGVNNGHPSPSEYNSDSGHFLRWNPQVVLPGETIHLAYAYGAGNGKNYQEGVINFLDQMSPAIILTDPSELYYTNAPFTSETKVVNQSNAQILSGAITLKIPREYLRVENDMLLNGWVKDVVTSGSDPNYDYYTYNVGAIDAFATHLVYPSVHLDVIPQCVSDINTSYWLILDVETDIAVEVVPDTIQKNLHIPKLNCFVGGKCLDLYATGISSEGCISLEWQWLPPKPTGSYGFTLYQWDTVLGDWQTASTNYDKTIKVLNVYPDIAGSNTLKTWMDDPTVGLGKILVTPITITNFNANPEFYLKSGGEYIYDAIMFGSWDWNSNKDLIPMSAAAVRDFLNSGRGVIFGHDTQVPSHSYFASLSDKTNLHLDPSVNMERGSTNITAINDGFLLKYPHVIPYNSILSIPLTHSGQRQFAKGIIWMNFPDPLVNPGAFNAPETLLNGGTNNFYLTTWNNASVIQTGHSNAASTLDERKVIANTLWYVAQFTTDTTAKICSAFDLAAPNTPTAELRDCNLIDILSKDNGTSYRFFVKATNTSHYADTCTSNILDVINKSGLKGFYILEDLNPAGTPELSNPFTEFIAAVDNQSVTYTVQDITKYIHIQAVDSAGNLSEVLTVEVDGAYEVFLSASPTAGGTVTGAGEYSCEDPVTISAIPNEGYEFVKWTINTATGPLFTTSTDTSFLATQSLTLVANFVVKKYPIVLL